MMAVAAVGMTGLLASCGSGSAPDGSANGSVDSVRTEYRLGSASGRFIACDNIPNNAGRTQQTQVAVRFTLQGTIQDITLGLKGGNSNSNDNNFKLTVTGQDLLNVGNGKYRVGFNANSGEQGGLLPSSIVVTPTVAKVKVVSVNSANRVGYFYPQLDVRTGSSSFTIRDILGGSIDVYSTCTVTATTSEDI